MKRERLDKVLVDRGFAASRDRAQRLVMAGAVRLGDRVIDKAGTMIAPDAELTVTESDIPFVSRGGVKLAGGLDAMGIDVAGRRVLDVGASTGGFTDCVLQRGAAAVLAIDVGYGQFDWRLRSDPRVVLRERLNVRQLTAADLPWAPDVVVVDVSFISLRLVLPVLVPLVARRAALLLLVKPQFEVGKGEVGGGGVVRDPAQHRAVVDAIKAHGQDLGLELLGECESPIRGPKGNREFFVGFRAAAS